MTTLRDVKHRHIWGPRTGIGRVIALAIAKGWLPAVCVECGKPRRKRA